MIAAAAACVAVALAAPPVGSVEELPKLLQEEFDLLEALDQLDEDRAAQEKALAENQQKREEVIHRRDEAARLHKAAKDRLRTERERIRRRIRVWIGLQRVKEWQLVASAGDYATWLHKRRLLSRLVKEDEERIKGYHDTVRRYREAEATLEHELTELEAVEQRIKTARATLIRDTEVKATLLESVRSEKAFWAKAGKDTDKAAKALQEQIDHWEEWKERRLWFRDLKGQYLFPVNGSRIELGYGNHTHPRFGTVTFHRGIDFVPGKIGDKTVRSIYWGKVVFAGVLRGYGNTVILDHTKRDYTLYAHLAKMSVKPGDVVKSRQKIGVLGESGSFEGEKLYFELRIDGQPIDPHGWFR